MNNTKLFFALFVSALISGFTGSAAAQTVTTAPTPQQRLVKPTNSVKPVVPNKKSKSVNTLERGSMLNMLYIAADEQGIPRRLLASLVEVESRGRPCATSFKGARGLTQLMPATARRFGLTVSEEYDARCDPAQALRVGAVYLRWLVDYFGGDVILALAGYNAGEGAVDKYGGRIPPYKETILYVEKILQLYTGKSGLSVSRAYNLNTTSIYLAQLGVNTRSALTSAVSTTTLPVRNPQISENRTEAEVLPQEKPRIEETRLPMKSFFYPPDDQDKDK
jgi:Transglycosylase SLT domain